MRCASLTVAAIVLIAGIIDTAQGCCDKIYIRDPTNTVKRVHKKLFDTTFNYQAENQTKVEMDSAFPYYYTSENGFAIWFLDEFGQWVVGKQQNRGTTTSAYAFAEAPAARCPEHVAHVFKYYDHAQWKEAGRGLSFFCRGSVKVQDEEVEEKAEVEKMGKKAEEKESA